MTTEPVTTDDQLRELVRQAIARHLRRDAAPPGSAQPVRLHASQGRFPLPTGDDACLIEPAVRCSHCGYCQSYGH